MYFRFKPDFHLYPSAFVCVNMGTRKENVEMKVKEVEDKEVELCVAHLRFLSKFYITIIENKQAQMNMAHTQFLADRDDLNAYREWTGSKAKILDLYEYWLRELLNVTLVDDIRAICMHQMMATDCYWFLAKMHRRAFHNGHSNYEMACRCMEKILRVLIDLLPQQNTFVVYLIRKYSILVLDYRKAIGLGTSSSNKGASLRIPMHMFERDVDVCRSSISTCRTYINKLIGASKPGASSECSSDFTPDTCAQVRELSKLLGDVI
ncbi:hypothetical protein Aduo_008697 [Ancylostoma duodenale]